MKKFYGAVMALALSMSAVAGCGSAETSAPEETTTETTTQTTDQKEEDKASEETAVETVEIDWWAFPTFAVIDDTSGKYEESIVAAFEAENPEIKVNVEMLDFASGPEKITNAIQGGTMADILFDAPGRIISYGKNGVLADVNSLFTEEFMADVDNDNLLAACSDGEDYYMYPISSAPFLMAFNKTMLEEHGLLDMINLEGDRAWTVGEYEALITALAEKGERGAVVFCVSAGGDQGPRAYVSNLAGTPITNDDLSEYTINSAEAVAALENLVGWVDEGLLLNGSALDGTASIEEFVAGRVSHTILYSPGINNNNKSRLEFEPVFLPYPTPEGVNPQLEYLVNGFAIFDNEDAAKIEASKKFIDFMCNDEEWGPKNVKQTSSYPVRGSFGNLYEGDEDMSYLSGLTKYYSTYYNTIDGFDEMRTYWFPMMQAAFAGDKDAQTALDDFVTSANQSILNAQ